MCSERARRPLVDEVPAPVRTPPRGQFERAPLLAVRELPEVVLAELGTARAPGLVALGAEVAAGEVERAEPPALLARDRVVAA